MWVPAPLATNTAIGATTIRNSKGNRIAFGIDRRDLVAPPGPLFAGLSVPLEELDSTFVLLRRGPGREGAEIPAPARPRVLFSRVEAILASRHLTDHG